MKVNFENSSVPQLENESRTFSAAGMVGMLHSRELDTQRRTDEESTWRVLLLLVDHQLTTKQELLQENGIKY